MTENAKLFEYVARFVGDDVYSIEMEVSRETPGLDWSHALDSELTALWPSLSKESRAMLIVLSRVESWSANSDT